MMALPSMKDQARAVAHDALMRQIGDRLDIPCRGPRSGAWQSTNSTLQEYAAKECWQCPVVEQCRAYALEHEKDRCEVWGGMRPRQAVKQMEIDLEGVA
ncbi:WhiB family transcriptional regulator [Scrofimicrobium canadense]|nr:WhiB family transcriptional regulator [Scrofimicrobium canadense]